MILDEVIVLLKKLRLHSMAEALVTYMDNPDFQFTNPLELLLFLCEMQLQENDNNRYKRNARAASLRYAFASLADVVCLEYRGLSKAIIDELVMCYWIRKCQHIILTGLTGSGKTWLACALANKALQEGYTAYYIRFSELLVGLDAADENSQIKFRQKLIKPTILIIDDFGLAPLTDSHRSHLNDLFEARDENGSFIITSQLDFNAWYEYVGNHTLADTMMDRIKHRSHKFNLQGDKSMRELLHSIEENDDVLPS